MQTYICIYMIHPDIHIYKILHICTPAQVRRVTALVYPPRQAKDNVPKSAPPQARRVTTQIHAPGRLLVLLWNEKY